MSSVSPAFTNQGKRFRRPADERSITTYKRLKAEGVKPSIGVVLSALKLCTDLKDIQTGKEIHRDVLTNGDFSTIFVANSLLNLYAKCGSLADARQVFDAMERRSVVSWTAMILGYAQSGHGQESLQLYDRMQHQARLKPNRVAVLAALKACTSLADKEDWTLVEGTLLKLSSLQTAKALHSEAASECVDLPLGPFVESALVDIYWRCGSISDARNVFENMEERDTVSWNAIILGYAQNGYGEIALELYRRMREEGCPEDRVTVLAALKACASVAEEQDGSTAEGKVVKSWCVEQGRRLHSLARTNGFEMHLSLANSLVDMYSKCGSMEEARSVFERIHPRSVVSWNCLLMGYAHAGEGKLALKRFSQMQEEGFTPDSVTYVAVFKSCTCLGSLELGRQVHAQVCNEGVDEVTVVGNALVDFYGKCGSMKEAEEVFEAIPRKSLVSWSSLIAGYSTQGDVHKVFGLFERMLRERVQPDGVTFLGVLMACRHAGLLDRAREWWRLMREVYRIVPSVHHFTCMVDLLCQGNYLQEAVGMVKRMPVEADVITWMVILDSAVKWKNVRVGELAFESVVRLDPHHASAHVLMSNIYAGAGMRGEACRVLKAASTN